MTLDVLRPDATITSGGSVSPTGGTLQAVVADASDSTYVYFPDSGYLHMVRYGFDTTTIPENAVIKSVTPRVRHDNTAPPDLTRTLQVMSGTRQFPIEALNYHGTTITQTGIARAFAPDGRPWTQESIDALEVEVRFQLTPTYRPSFLVHALYLDVLYNEAPVAVGTEPNATVETARPRWEWSYTDAEGDAQDRSIVDVFSDTQIAEPGFDPLTTTPIVSSGEVFSSVQYWDCSVALDNNHTYRAYIRVADRGSDGRYNLVDAAGPYAWAEVHMVELAAPTIDVVAPATPNAAVELLLSGRDNILTAKTGDLENASGSSDRGEWKATGTNCTAANVVTTGMPSGTRSLGITCTASPSGDIELSTITTNVAARAEGEMWGGFAVRVNDAPGVDVEAVLLWLDIDGAVIDETVGPTIFCSDDEVAWCFVRGESIYVDDAKRVALAIRALALVEDQVIHLDSASISPNPINQVRNPAFAFDSDADGLADEWTVVNTGGDPAPTVTIDTEKVFGGVASQRIEWPDNNGVKGIQQVVRVGAFAGKLVQAWVAFETAATDEPIINIRHGGLPWLGVSTNGFIPPDGEFHPITVQLTNSGSWTDEYLQIATEQGGACTMWIGCVAAVEPWLVTADFGAADWDGDEIYGHFNLALTSGPFSHGGAVGSQYFELQRSLDGDTWETMSRVGTDPDDWQISDLIDIDPDALNQTVDAFDFEAPPQTVHYRARSVATLDGATLVGNWSRWTSVVVPAGGWWLKSITDPSLSVKLYVHNQTLKWTSASRESVNYALGRTLPVVLWDAISGDVAPLQLSFFDDASYEAFETLRATGTTFLLQSSYGDHRYVRLIGARDEEFMLNGGNARKRIVSVTVAEVGEP